MPLLGENQMRMKKVLVVEDLKIYFEPLTRELETAGFMVYVARNPAEARGLAEQYWEEFDVIVLDMDLNDANELLTTGADIGIEFRQRKDSFPPESLIYSVKNQINYYRLALKLGAAAYLLKEEVDVPVVVQHVRVLALRHALNGENPKVAAEVARIAARSRTQSEAILTFCRQVLKQEFEACLGTDFVILFTEENTTINCADNAGLPEKSDPFYHTLQALAHGKGNLTEPFILEARELDRPADPDTRRLHEKFDLAAFLPLSLSNDKKLSIGILPKGTGLDAAADAKALCTVLAQYLRPTVLENVISIWSQWTELHATRSSTAKLCLSVGQEIKDGLESEDMEQLLSDLANDLNDTGQYLTQLDNRGGREEEPPVSVSEVVESSWDLIRPEDGQPVPRLDLQGACAVRARSSDVAIIVSRLLQWFMYRSKNVPPGIEPAIRVRCEEADGGATVVFEDNSRRLPKKLREDLFAPFTQAISTPFADLTVRPASGEHDGKEPLTSGRYLPLYLAKMLVEGRYRGILEDHSDEITEMGYGHRILMHLPGMNNVV
jgi:DNA-binding NarL/FixJ family response regulator